MLSSRSIRLTSACSAALLISACSDSPDLPLGQELPLAEQQARNEAQTTRDISKLLSDHLKEQYHGEKFLRDTHPKDNGCIRGTFTAADNAPAELAQGVFSKGSEYPVWVRFSNSVEEITSDHENDFRGLGMKLTQVNGERQPLPGDEDHTQDFLFLGHDAFFAEHPKDFFDFFDAAFNGSPITFAVTHPRGTWNIFEGSQQFKNPLNLNWNSVTPYALGQPKTGDNGELTYPNIVRYALQTCAKKSDNYGDVPPEPSPDYLAENLAEQLKDGTACLDFFVQLQKDPKENQVENILYAWDQKKSPFIKVAQVNFPTQTFTSEAQKEFCENISFNPWHSLTTHRPLGGINRARKIVMKDISDLRLKENGVERTEPTGYERF